MQKGSRLQHHSKSEYSSLALEMITLLRHRPHEHDDHQVKTINIINIYINKYKADWAAIKLIAI